MGVWQPGPGATNGNDSYFGWSDTVGVEADLLDGDDLFHGGNGDDDVDGGAGNDSIHGAKGNNILAGGDGNDRIDAGNGSNTISGGASGTTRRVRAMLRGM
jgi:Ca2+-binding RTX toxin-like protein